MAIRKLPPTSTQISRGSRVPGSFRESSGSPACPDVAVSATLTSLVSRLERTRSVMWVFRRRPRSPLTVAEPAEQGADPEQTNRPAGADATIEHHVGPDRDRGRRLLHRAPVLGGGGGPRGDEQQHA